MALYVPDDPDRFVDEVEQKIRDHVLRVMPHDPSGELEGSSLDSLLLTYGNWRSRFVHPHPRTVHLSAQLRAAGSNVTGHQTAFAAIVAALEAGHKVTPYLSRGIKTAYVPRAQRSRQLHRRPDLDLLISDWGLHHLHLTTELESDGFVKRTEDLLFAAFTDRDAYLIGIYPHGSWVLRELVEVLVREWSDNPAVVVSLSGVSLAHSVSEDDYLQLRKGGVATLVEVDGRVVMPGFGMTTAGTPVRVTVRVNDIERAITDLRGNLDARLSALDEKYPVADGATATWEPWLEDDTWGLRRGDLVVPIADLW